jgi:hypothetical protein
MRVTEVTVVAKYSLDTGHGWKAIEVGATATLTASDETLETAQQELYARLSRQLKTLWAIGNGKAETQGPPSNGPDSPATTRQHFCVEHGMPFERRVNKDTGKEFYSHRQDKGWHNE